MISLDTEDCRTGGRRLVWTGQPAWPACVRTRVSLCDSIAPTRFLVHVRLSSMSAPRCDHDQPFVHGFPNPDGAFRIARRRRTGFSPLYVPPLLSGLQDFLLHTVTNASSILSLRYYP